MKTRRKSQSEPVCRPLVAALRLFLALFLALCLVQQPAYAQAPIAAPQGAAPQELTATPSGALAAGAPADDPAKGCDDNAGQANYPPTGQTAKVVADDEIFLAYRYESTQPYLRQKVINFDRTTNKLATVKDEAWSSDAKLTNARWLTAAAGDLNGTADGKRVDRIVAGFQNKDGQVDVIADAPVDSTADKNWWCQYSSNDSRCDDATQMDVATGNLDMSSDGSDEIAVFYRDNDDDYMIMTLDGGSDGTISTAADTWVGRYNEDQHPGRERGDVNHMAIATGDLNGDGFDNEIVTAVKDSDSDLQVSVHRGTEANEIFFSDLEYGNPWIGDTVAAACDGYNNFRPMDIATGDVDGDQKDEIIVATKDGPCTDARVHLIVFDFTGEDSTTHKLTVDTTVQRVNLEWQWYEEIHHNSYNGVPDISIAAADLDGDGYDEIAVGLTRHFIEWNEQNQNDLYSVDTAVTAFEYFRANTSLWEEYCPKPATPTDPRQSCLYKYASTWGSDPDYPLGEDTEYYARMWLAAGDVDADGNAEIAVSRIAMDKSLQVTLFRANTTTVTPVDTLTIASPDGSWIHEPPIAMGDFDGDSKWGTFAGTCSDKLETLVQAVIQDPPVWPYGLPGLKNCSSDWDAKSHFGYQSGEISEQEKTMSTQIGSSVKTSGEHKWFGGSFARSWERSVETVKKQATGQALAYGYETSSPQELFNSGEEPYYAGVLTIENTNYCYDYNVPGINASDPSAVSVIPVCAYQPDKQSQRSFTSEAWYSDEEGKGARSLYGDSWIPLGANLAVDKTQKLRVATQSSTFTNGTPHGDAYRAVDGNTDGVFVNGSATSTNVEYQPWWQVDLGGIQWIDAIQIWNRTDANVAGRTKNYYVLTTQTDFAKNADQTYKPLSDLLADSSVWQHYEAEQAGTPTTITVGEYARRVRVQLTATDALNLAEVQVYGRPGTPDQWPVRIKQGDGTFDLGWRIGATTPVTSTVPGQVYMTWSKDSLYASSGGLTTFFNSMASEDQSYLEGSGVSRSLEVGMEVKKKGKASRERDAGIGHETTYASGTTWGSEVEVGAQVAGVTGPNRMSYHWAPYIWMQESVPPCGGTENYLMLDYLVTDATLTFPQLSDAEACRERTGVGEGPTPQAPLVSSPTHPDPEAWSRNKDATFTWAQPPGDTTVVGDYAWALDHRPAADPRGSRGPTTSATLSNVGDGEWYLHVAARTAQGRWGATAHRKLRVDANAPQVSLTLDPPQATGNAGWYTTPVDVTVAAQDAGSGVASIEYSLDGHSWHPYVQPLHLSADAPGATVYARATDAVGHVSEPVSTTIKIDRTPPDSHVTGGAGPGALVAEVTTNGAGNAVVVLAGAIADNVSGRAGMILEDQGTYWGADAELGSWHPLPDPAIEVNWTYTATHELGAGYHIFTGRARDEAGNQEAAYEIARLVVPPQASPDLSGSTVAASQQTARPGDEIMLTLVGRNAGFQEAHIAITDTLPVGLEPVLAALPDGVTYDAATRTLTWPSRPVWPGNRERREILTKVDPSLGATVMENRATFHAFWPNTDLLPEADQKQFLDREQTVVATNRIVVNPKLAAGADLVSPWVVALAPSRDLATGPEVPLSIIAAADARRMYLREWAPDPVTGAWKVVQNSGWIDFSPTYTWKLSAGQGVKYVGVWVADAAGNISTLEEPATPFVNRVDENQVLADGQRIQYRALLDMGSIVWASLKTVSGDPDLYAWGPRNGFWPDRSANATLRPGGSEELATDSESGTGRYIIEVQAVEASEYGLSFPGTGSETAVSAAGRAVTKPRPEHPLTISDPLSAGQVGPAVTLGNKSYLPLIFRSN